MGILKRITRSRPVQEGVALLFARYLGLVQRTNRFVISAGPLPEPRPVFDKAELEVQLDHVLFTDDVEAALEIARDLLRLNPDWQAAAKP